MLPDDVQSVDDAPDVDVATSDTPVVDVPARDAQVIDAPIVDAPIVDAPTVDAPADANVDAGAAITCAAGGGWVFPGVGRACAGDSDCVAVTHQTDCCGNARVTGISSRDAEAFRTHEAHCASMFPACGCPARQPTADDGNTVSDPSGVAVHCVAAQCVTVVASHG